MYRNLYPQNSHFHPHPHPHPFAPRRRPLSPFATYARFYKRLRQKTEFYHLAALFVVFSLLVSPFSATSVSPGYAAYRAGANSNSVNTSAVSGAAPAAPAALPQVPTGTVTSTTTVTNTVTTTANATTTPGITATAFATSSSTPFTTPSTPSTTTSSTPSTSTPPPSITVSVTPPPPTYTVGTPLVIPTISPIPDTNYIQKSVDSARDALLAQVSALPALTSTITGTLVSGATGGRITSADGGLMVGILPGAVELTDTVNVQVNRITFAQGDPRALNNGQPIAYTYELTATSTVSGRRITHFNSEVALIWNIDFSSLRTQGAYGFPLYAYTYNEQTSQWEEAPGRWNPSANQLIITTPHFSDYGVDPAFDMVKNYLPGVDNFQVDLQSGTSSMQYPISLPPGPAGFGPKVMLSYNSGNIDHQDWTQQGTSSVGWGWSLSTNYIAATQHNYPKDGVSCGGGPRGYHPWTASVVSDGINGDLTLGADGYWHTANESFARVRYNPGADTMTQTNRMNDSWEAWDKDGAHYVFDLQAYTIDNWYDAQGALCVTPAMTTYKWMLHTATDVHGNTITYSYMYEPDIASPTVEPTPRLDKRTRAVYPSGIDYGADGNKVQVVFSITTRTIDGVNDISDNDVNKGGIYQSFRVNQIDVKRSQQPIQTVTPTATPAYTILRSYVFSESYNIVLTTTVRPTATETPEPILNYHLTLDGIVVKGNDAPNQTRLPSMKFNYWSELESDIIPMWDWGHLRRSENGYGGAAMFYYDQASGDTNESYRRVRAKKIEDGLAAINDPSMPHVSTYYYDYRGGNDNRSSISADASNQKPLHDPDSEFRGFTWAREIVSDTSQVTDHYFNQDDVFRGKEWRMQSGKTDVFTANMNLPTPPATVTPDANWNVTGNVQATVDPDVSSNNTWLLPVSSSIQRAGTGVVGTVGDGYDIAMRFRVKGSDNYDVQDQNFLGTWKLESTTGNPADYWGLQVYRKSDPHIDTCPHEPRMCVWRSYAKLVWSVNGVAGERDLSTDSNDFPNLLLPRARKALSPETWYWVRLHTSPDGRFMAEIYGDDLALNYPDPSRNPLSLPALYSNYIGVKSGDSATNGTVPLMATGKAWRFKNEVTLGDNNHQLYADDYSETRTLYAQSDSTYEERNPVLAATVTYTMPLIGQANNTDGMNIRFVPLIQSMSAKYGELPNEVGLVKQARKTFDYDNFGNQTAMNDYGDVTWQGDERSMASTYVTAIAMNPPPAASQYIVDKVGHALSYQGIQGVTTSTLLMAETQFFYDYNAGYGYIPPLPEGKGRLTQTKQAGVLSGVRNGQNSVQQFHYDLYGNQDAVTDPLNNQTLMRYDDFYHSFPISTTHPNGRTELTEYDYTLDVISSTLDMNNTRMVYRYDQFGRPKKSWTIAPDRGYGSEITPTEQYAFSDVNQDSISAPFYISYTTYLDENAVGEAGYSWHTRWFDGRGRALQDVSPKDPLTGQAVIVNNTYTVTGVLSTTSMPYTATVTDPFSYTPPNLSAPKTVHYYDGAGRPTLVVNPDGTRILNDYTLLQWTGISEVMDGGISHEKWQHTDLLGRTDKVTERENGPTGIQSVMNLDYAYDSLDRLTTVMREGASVGLNPTTQISYDELGRKSQLQDPDMGTWKYKYDAAGNMTVQTDTLYLSYPTKYPGHQLFFQYDNMNRVTDKFYGQAHFSAGISDVKWYYDNALGDASATHSWGRVRMAEVTAAGQGDKANKHFYTYDGRGLPATDVITVSNTYTSGIYSVSYGYDIGKRLTTVDYPDPTGEQAGVQYNRQGMGMPRVMTSTASTYPSPVSDMQYNERGQISSIVQGSGGNALTTAYAYTVRGWLTNTLVTAPNGIGGTNTMLNLGLTYTSNGNVKSMSNQDPGGNGSNGPTFTNTYFYDGLNRLKSASSTSSLGGGLFPDEGYSFDDLGRMSSRTISSTTYNYAYNDTAHVDAPTGYMGNGYSYDGAGNQASGTVKGVSQNRTYDAQNRVSSVTTGTTTLSFVYDANDKRVVQNVTTGSTTKRTLYVGNLYEEEISNPSRPYTVYYMMGEKMVGLRRGNQTANNGQYRMVTDHLGSTSLMVDTASPPTVVNRAYYKPYGEVAFESGNSLTTVGYTGQRLDGDSGLMYYGARYYDPVLSMFISADPTVPDAKHAMDFNKYLYVRGNPLRFIDELGYGPDDHYVFVEGCYGPISSSRDCSSHDWGEYYSALRGEYGKWKAEYARRYGETLPSFEDWANGRNGEERHLHYVVAYGDTEGAEAIDNTLKGIQGNGNIHLLGHSYGASAIATYFAAAYLHEKLGDQYIGRPNITLDKRIASAILVDPWLAPTNPYLGKWLGEKHINVLTVDTQNDFANGDPFGGGVEGVKYVGDPTYPKKCDQYGCTPTSNRIDWHMWTSLHIADETRRWLATWWR